MRHLINSSYSIAQSNLKAAPCPAESPFGTLTVIHNHYLEVRTSKIVNYLSENRQSSFVISKNLCIFTTQAAL